MSEGGLPPGITIEIPGSSASYREAASETGEPILLRARITEPVRMAAARRFGVIALAALGTVAAALVAFFASAELAIVIAIAGGPLVLLPLVLGMASALASGVSALTAIVAARRAQRIEIGTRTIRAWTEGSRFDLRLRRDVRLRRADIVAVRVRAIDGGLLRTDRPIDAALDGPSTTFCVATRGRLGTTHALVEDLASATDAAVLARRIHEVLGPEVALEVPRIE